MIDLHTHILPGLDDGPKALEAAVEMARVAEGAGTRAVAATSHVDHGFGVDIAGLAGARAALAERQARVGVELELLAGGEVAPERLSELDDAALASVALGGGPTVLLECPFAPVGSAMEAMVADLHARGFAVLLAHPERSASFIRSPELLAALVDRGAAAQITTGSLAGRFGDSVRAAAERMLEAGLVHVIASDAHDPVRRAPDLRVAEHALRERYDGVEEQFAWMTEAAPAALVAGEPLPARPPLPRPRRRLGRLRSAWSGR
jgi:protein-tyrosine phosphatase